MSRRPRLGGGRHREDYPTLGSATHQYALGYEDEGEQDDADPDDVVDETGYVFEGGRCGYYEMDDEEGAGSLSLEQVGEVDPVKMLEAIDAIGLKFLTPMEHDLVWLMRRGTRPVEISRILGVAECEVVRLRRNALKKIRLIYLYDYHHDKALFFSEVIPRLGLNAKQERIFRLFFEFHGLRQIAETIGTRPSNVHRSLQVMRKQMEEVIPEGSPHRFYLQAFHDFKYLYLTQATP